MKIFVSAVVYYAVGLLVLAGLEEIAPGGKKLGRSARAVAAWLWPLAVAWVLLQLALWLPMFVVERVGDWINPKVWSGSGWVKVGRNAECPCGSGRKFKKCCIARRNAPR